MRLFLSAFSSINCPQTGLRMAESSGLSYRI